MNEPFKITGYTSNTLDGLRILAALSVFVFHVFYLWFLPLTVSLNIGDIAHVAVIVFFVLSGYLIAYTTSINNRGRLQYLQARFSRLYSVVLPALVITAICEIIIVYFNPAMHAVFTRGLSWPRYIISGLFLNEIWFFSAAPPLDAPLWSLSFEFWYYIIFGLWFYRKSGPLSYILPVLACLIAGPKIILMMPIWLTGYFAYRTPRPALKKTFSWLIFIFSFVMAGFLIVYLPPLPCKLGTSPLFFSGQFFTDWIIGFCIGCALWIMPKDNTIKQSKWTQFLRVAADLTFPLYVLHNPLLILWNSIFVNKIHHVAQLWQPVLSVLIVSIIIGIVLENQRFLWSRFFKRLFSYSRKIKWNL